EEVWVRNHRHLSTVGYSYWTLGYILSAEGARRLLDAKPLDKLLPVDEYFPIMFNKHPNKVSLELNGHHIFPCEISAHSLCIHSAYFLSDTPMKEGYVSDTEDSVVVEEEHGSVMREKKDEL
ncbi:hypothetical protein COOONC_17785, partial [Cooperia oncophora]